METLKLWHILFMETGSLDIRYNLGHNLGTSHFLFFILSLLFFQNMEFQN